MSTVVSDLQNAYNTGVANAAAESGFSSVVDWFTGTDSTEDAIKAQLQATQGFITQLDTTLRQQVENGQDQNGNAFTIDQWMSFAKDVGDDIQSQTGYVWDASGLTILYNTLKQTGHDVQNPFAWPWWAWGLLGLAGLIVLRPYVELGAAALPSREEHAA